MDAICEVKSPPCQADRRRALYDAHRRWHRESFDSNGAWCGAYPRHPIGDAREWLWHALAFFDGDNTDVAIANTLCAATPNVANHFNGIAAALILLRHPHQLSTAARHHLLTIVQDLHAEAVDFGFSVNSVNNFSAMWAFYHLASSQLLDLYEPSYTHKSIPEVYNHTRMRQFGLNVLQIMDAQLNRTDISKEFNSPTYSPIALMHMAEVVNLVDHEPAKEVATRIERRLWQELLSFHHPALHQTSGPHSRAYTVDSVGHASGWKILCCALGIDGATTIEDLLYPPQAGQILHATGDLAHQQCFAVWLARADYHPPADVLAAFHARSFPYTVSQSYEWPGKGHRRSDGSIIKNVEGEACYKAGTGIASCYQECNFAVGTMSQSYTGQNRPCHVVYQLNEPCQGLGSCRTATMMMLTEPMPDWTQNPLGEATLLSHIPNHGEFRLEQNGGRVNGSIRPYTWALSDVCEEISANLLVSEHLPDKHPVDQAQLDGLPFDGPPIEKIAESAIFTLTDGAVRMAWTVRATGMVTFSITRRAGFLRCAVIFPKTPRREEELSAYHLEVQLEVRANPCEQSDS